MTRTRIYANGGKRSKYGSKKTVVDGIEFDSRREANRWFELRMFERAGVISNLERQVKFVLIPQQREPDSVGPKGGKIRGKLLENEVAYVADFVYLENGVKVVEDAKGFRTPDYVIKRKLMLFIHHVRIKEV